MKKKILFLLKIVFSLILVIYVIRKIDLPQVWQFVKGVNLFWLSAAYLIHLADYPISTFRWKLLLDAQGVELPYRRLLASYFVGSFFNTFLPTTMGGDVLRACDTIRWGKKGAKPLMAIFVEKLSGLFVLMAIAGGILFFSGLEIQKSSLLIWICSIFFILLGFMLFLTLWPPLAKVAGGFFSLPGLKFFRKWIKEMYEATRLYRHKPRVLFKVLLVAGFLQFTVVLHYYLIGKALGIPVPLVFYFLIIPVISLILTLPITIGGIGVRESAYVIFFSAYGVLQAQALALAWLAYSFVILSALIGAIIYVGRK